MTRHVRKLALAKETLRRLDATALRLAHGGTQQSWNPTPTVMCEDSEGCPATNEPSQCDCNLLVNTQTYLVNPVGRRYW